MSFILDALKKSESDRQRQNGPALFEVKVAPPRTHLPAWAIAIAVLLVVNLGVVMWMLMRHPVHNAPAAQAPAPPQVSAPPALASATGPAPVLTTAPSTPPAPAPEPSAGTGAVASALPSLSAGAAGAAASAPSASPGTDGGNPDDYAPAEEAPPAAPASGSLSGRVRRATASGVPLYQDAAATPGTQIPQLRLDLHVFAARAQDRFVMINMHKVHEGDTLPEGVHVDSITPEGAVLSYNGSRFLLPRE